MKLFYLEKQEFINIIDDKIMEFLTQRIYLQDDSVKLEDFVYIKTLGVGNFGNVFFVKNIKNSFYYAVKAISKSKIIMQNLILSIEMEKRILLQTDHPFIMKMVCTLKDENFIYFLMEFIKAQELFDVIRYIGLLNKQQTQFYAASLMITVDYLHKNKIVYRDIKPENIMVNEKVIKFY